MRQQQREFMLRDVAAMDAGEIPPMDGLFVSGHSLYDGFEEIDGGHDDE